MPTKPEAEDTEDATPTPAEQPAEEPTYERIVDKDGQPQQWPHNARRSDGTPLYIPWI